MDRHRRALSRTATAAVPIAFLALFFAWPLVAIMRRSLVVDGRLDVPWGVVTSGVTREVLWFTLWQATVSTALTLAAGLPLAWALSRFRFRGRSVVEAFVLVVEVVFDDELLPHAAKPRPIANSASAPSTLPRRTPLHLLNQLRVIATSRHDDY